MIPGQIAASGHSPAPLLLSALPLHRQTAPTDGRGRGWRPGRRNEASEGRPLPALYCRIRPTPLVPRTFPMYQQIAIAVL